LQVVTESRSRTPGSHAIKVSEIAEYSYCSRAWWYKHVVKLPPGEIGRLAAGTRAHRRHGRWVAASARLRVLGVALALCGLLALAVTVGLMLAK
jgi:CRISPR/Cas system-associated exonuclease Cas4 (RecB family)